MPAGELEADAVDEREVVSSKWRRADSAVDVTGAAPVRGLKRSLGVVPTWMWVLLFYLLMGVLTIGRHAIAHPRTVCACVGSGDPASYMWAMYWWPHALIHGLNPFESHYLWSPVGVNTAQGTLIPTAAFAMAPFTALFGGLFSYNLLSVASVVLGAFTAYLLCRRLVQRELPAVAGGYLFGFSSYEFGQLTGHLNLTLTFLIPVMAHLALRRFDREISRRVYVIVMALVLVLQAGLSTELLAESAGFAAVIFLSARLLAPSAQRPRIDGLILETAGGGLLALVVGSPFFYYALFSGEFPKGPGEYGDVYAQDLLNTFFPTIATWLGHHDFQSLSTTYVGGGVTGDDGYLSIPLVIAFLAWAVGVERRRTLTRLVVIVAAVGFVASLGAHLHIAGIQTVTLPFDWVQNLPIFNDLLPSRIALFTSLAVAIGVAAWLARPGGHVLGRWLVVLLAIVMIFPNITSPLFGIAPSNPRFFSTALYKRYLTPNETILVLPFGYNDISTLWQAETGFDFYMPEGYVSQVTPAPFDTQPTVDQLLSNVPPAPPVLGSFIREHHVSHVVVDPARAGPWPGALAQLGLHGRSIGGVFLYSVPPEPR
jgi:hypothetical protein